MIGLDVLRFNATDHSLSYRQKYDVEMIRQHVCCWRHRVFGRWLCHSDILVGFCDIAICITYIILEMWANAQRDGRPAEYRRRALFNAAKFG